MRTGLVLIGGGGHCRSCLEVLSLDAGRTVLGILDLPGRLGSSVLGCPVIGTDDDLPALASQGNEFLVTLGHAGDPGPRRMIFERLQDLGARVATLVSPLAHLSAFAQVGPGSVALHHALVNAGAAIGANAILNTGSLVEHDARIGDHAHVSTRAVVNGGCTVGEGSFLGSGSVISHGVALGPGILLGAGTVVIRDLLEPGTYVGCPARRVGR